jgi:hypothetical protein
MSTSRAQAALPEGEGPDFGGPFTQVPCAQRGRACTHMVFLFSPPSYSLEGWRRPPYLYWSSHSSTSKVELKFAPFSFAHMGLYGSLRLIGILQFPIGPLIPASSSLLDLV